MPGRLGSGQRGQNAGAVGFTRLAMLMEIPFTRKIGQASYDSPTGLDQRIIASTWLNSFCRIVLQNSDETTQRHAFLCIDTHTSSAYHDIKKTALKPWFFEVSTECFFRFRNAEVEGSIPFDSTSAVPV
jgi:hypothetical protein